jgi:hypothetical protein
MTTFANRARDRATHMQLVTDAERRAAARDEADTQPNPITHADLAQHWPPRQAWLNAMPGCHGPCDNGNKLCPCPDACGLIECRDAQRNDVGMHRALAEWLAIPTGVVVALAIVGAIVAAVGALHFWRNFY